VIARGGLNNAGLAARRVASSGSVGWPEIPFGAVGAFAGAEQKNALPHGERAVVSDFGGLAIRWCLSR